MLCIEALIHLMPYLFSLYGYLSSFSQLISLKIDVNWPKITSHLFSYLLKHFTYPWLHNIAWPLELFYLLVFPPPSFSFTWFGISQYLSSTWNQIPIFWFKSNHSFGFNIFSFFIFSVRVFIFLCKCILYIFFKRLFILKVKNLNKIKS